MPFTEINKPLLEAAAAIDFQLTKTGNLNSARHTQYELGLYFIKRAIEKHGNKYGYNKVNYVNNTTKVTIICKEHNDVVQTPKDHLKGGGCGKCAGKSSLTTKDFVERATLVHDNRYNYDKVKYKTMHEKIEIICSEHGSFFQLPSNHLKGQGCAKCAGKAQLTSEEFILKAKEVHGENTYNYDLVDYKSNKEKIAIICPVHGVFHQTPTHHIHSGNGCPKCAGKYSPTTEEFIEKARNVHGDKYDYSNAIYKGMLNKIEIICPEHGVFYQTPAHHIHDGNCCPKCSGYNHDILYLLKCKETGWYKIGITTNNTKNRIRRIGSSVEEIHHVRLEDPRKHESILHKMYTKDREYNLCANAGHTEFFSITEDQVQEVIDYMNEVAKNA